MRRLFLPFLGLTALTVAVALGPKAVRFLAIDRCLDGGGAWDYAADSCTS